MMYYYVITYDIKDDRRRAKIFKSLKEYATPVQYSVFEGYFTMEDLVSLKHRIKKLMHEKEDSIYYYSLCACCREQITRSGVEVVVLGKDDIII
jgi:CRISPR-associated protein Cas2